jgi:hypothetical protein
VVELPFRITAYALAAFPGLALACGCGKPHDVRAYMVHKYASSIFEGKVTAVQFLPVQVGKCANVEFDVERLIRGHRSTSVTVTFCSGNSSCNLEDVNFEVGERYLISATKDRRYKAGLLVGDGYSSNLCQLRERLPALTPGGEIDDPGAVRK